MSGNNQSVFLHEYGTSISWPKNLSSNQVHDRIPSSLYKLANTYKLRASPGSIHNKTIVTRTQGNGDRPAGVPVCPAWLPEDPATGHTDRKIQKQEKNMRSSPIVAFEEVSAGSKCAGMRLSASCREIAVAGGS
ncbi:hypothetical protein F511_28154 [Dorcoceras hygrometricum]|uniref:Uncharacterized protein n=1 Tax=Dorcoceras hygrometricum TaxID=472368 RepID=A0A2Z7BKE1_9LAMI|nr:hypothetical protein F511_28154 [Dorcoceras hygrometricum]